MKKANELRNIDSKLPLGKRLQESWMLLLLLAPVLIYFTVFSYIPLYGLQIAFKKYRIAAGITKSQWIGLDHFAKFFRSSLAVSSLWNTVALSFSLLLFSIPVPIILSLSLNMVRGKKAKQFIQTATYLPYFISVMVVIGIMNQMLSPVSGVVNQFIELFGGERIYFMASENWFRPLYIISAIWQNSGYATIIYLAALSSVNPNLYEALQIDGGNLLHRARYIDFPNLAPVISIVVILRVGRLLSVGFEKTWLMQNDINITKSEILQTFVYKTGLLNGFFDYATAIGLMNTVFSLFLLVTVNTIVKKTSKTSLW